MTPRLYIAVGSAGSGKSRIARRLAARTGAVYLDKDILANGFTEALLLESGTDPSSRDGNPFYRTTVMDLEYATLWKLAAANLALGQSAVLDAPFLRWFDDPGFIHDVRRKHGLPRAPTTVLHVIADGETVRRRIAERGLPRDAEKLADWARFWEGVRSARCRWTGVHHVLIDNTAEEDDVATGDLLADALSDDPPPDRTGGDATATPPRPYTRRTQAIGNPASTTK